MTDSSLDQIGAILTSSPADWQILQADADGCASIDLAGRWVSPEAGTVLARLVSEDTGSPVARHLDWQPATMHPDGAWHLTLPRVPAGGLYRLETRYNHASMPWGEWSTRGDMRHCLGVGDLWIIAGQSNAAGYGRGPLHDPPELGVHLFNNAMRWGLATHPLNDSTNTAHPVNRESSNPGHAPWLHFGRRLKQQLGYPIGLLQTSLGGSPLSAWNPADPEPSGALYRNLARCVAAAGGRVRGLVWYQGESESQAGTGATYAARFAQAVAAWREALGQPDLPVLTVQVNRCLMPVTPALDLGWSLVREAQRQAAKTIPGVTVVPSLDLPLSDGIHTSPAGNLLLAERLARAALGAVHGRAVDYMPPDVQSAVAAPNGQTLTLTFAPVTSRMDCIDLNANPFRVEDETGVVPIQAVRYPGGPSVVLALGRALTGAAVVHGGYGLVPETVPMDIERLTPMLGFHNLRIAGFESEPQIQT